MAVSNSPPSPEAPGPLEHLEQWAVLFEESGLPPVAGRIWAWLLLNEQGATASELCEALGITKGSVSTATRLLMGAQLVSRRRAPGARQYQYEIRDDAVEALMASKLEAILAWRDLAEETVALGHATARPTERAERIHSFYAFLANEQRKVIERWTLTHAEND